MCGIASGLIVSMASADEASGAVAPFVGRHEVRYAELVEEMRRVADELAQTDGVRRAHAALLAESGLSAQQVPLLSFSRVRLAFEATRDGGLWGIRWAITDQMPWSDRIWAQWSKLDLSTVTDDGVTAVAECDELSALFALLARDLGVEGFVGLHWPYWNHTVAVWQLPGAEPRSTRILVPTSQVFLSREATLGTRELAAQRIVFPYVRKDLKPDSSLPGALVRFLIGRLHAFGALSSSELQARRNALGRS
jgi:hypothetical protein